MTTTTQHPPVHIPAGYPELVARIDHYLDSQDPHDRARTLCLLTTDVEDRVSTERRRLDKTNRRLRRH